MDHIELMSMHRKKFKCIRLVEFKRIVRLRLNVNANTGHRTRSIQCRADS